MFYKILVALTFSAVMSGCGGGDGSEARSSEPQSAPATATDTTSTSTAKTVTPSTPPTKTGTTPATVGSTVTAPATPTSTPPADPAPSSAIKSFAIVGKPATTALVGRGYVFQPTITADSDSAYTFSIANCPTWATFNPATGEITGTPTAAEVGTYAKISITVSADGTTESTAPFSIIVADSASGTTELSWVPPTENTNGTPLSDLAGYKIYYGTSPTALTLSTAINSPTTDTYVVSNLPQGTWYFEVRAVSTTNVESAASNIASKVIS